MVRAEQIIKTVWRIKIIPLGALPHVERRAIGDAAECAIGERAVARKGPRHMRAVSVDIPVVGPVHRPYEIDTSPEIGHDRVGAARVEA